MLFFLLFLVDLSIFLFIIWVINSLLGEKLVFWVLFVKYFYSDFIVGVNIGFLGIKVYVIKGRKLFFIKINRKW